MHTATDDRWPDAAQSGMVVRNCTHGLDGRELRVVLHPPTLGKSKWRDLDVHRAAAAPHACIRLALG